MKAILVIDMPKSCIDCKLENGGYCLVNEKELDIQTQSIRDKGCPLKPMPQKKIHIPELNIWEITEEDKEIMIENRGYNKCIDEILGEEE